MLSPSEEKLVESTLAAWPISLNWSTPVAASQIFDVLSHEPVTTREPSGEKPPVTIGKGWAPKLRKEVPGSSGKITTVTGLACLSSSRR